MDSSSSSHSETPVPRGIHWLRWVLGLALTLLVIRALLPTMLEWALAEQGGRALGSRVQIDDVELGILGGDISLIGVTISPPSDGVPGLRWSRARADLSWLALLRGELRVEVLELSGLELQVRRGPDGAVQIPGLVEPSPTGTAGDASESDGDSDPFSLNLERVVLQSLFVDFRDEGARLALELSVGLLEIGDVSAQTGEEFSWSLSDLRISEGTVSLARGDASPLELGFGLQASHIGSGADPTGRGRIEMRLGDGEMRISGPVAAALPLTGIELEWDKVDLPGLAPLTPPGLGLEVRKGTSSGQLRVDIGRGHAEGDQGGMVAGTALTARGRLEVLDLASELTAPRPLGLSWQQLQVELEELRVPLTPGEVQAERGASSRAASEPVAIRLASLVWVEPEFLAVRPKAAESQASSAATQNQSQLPPEPRPGSDPRLELGKLVVQRGGLRVEDRNFEPPLETSVSEITIEARDVRWPERVVADFRLTAGSLGREGPLTVSASGDGHHMKADVRASKVSLLPVAPYVRRNSNYVITRGEASVESKIDVEGSRFRAPTRLVLHDLLIEEQDADGLFVKQFGVPLDVALALLRDPVRGDITLKLPLEGTTDEGRVGLGRVFADSLRRVLVQSVATPLKLAGMLVPDPERSHSFTIPSVAFKPGEAEPKIERDRDPTTLAKLLTEHPELQLRIEAVLVEADLKALGKRNELVREEDGALSAAALRALGELAERRVSRVREEFEASLGGLSDRIVESPFNGKLGSGRPRVEGRLTLATRAR